MTALLCEELEQLVTGLAPLHSCAGEIVRGLEEEITTIFVSQCNGRLEKVRNRQAVKGSCLTRCSDAREKKLQHCTVLNGDHRSDSVISALDQCDRR